MNLVQRLSPDMPALPGGSLLRAVALLAILALFISACGGGDDDDSPDDASTGANGSTDSTGAAGPAGSTGGGAPGSTDVTGGAGPQVGGGSLTNLESYRYEIILEGDGSIGSSLGLPDLGGGTEGGGEFNFTINGAWKSPDQAQIEMDLGGLAFKQTVVGDQQWSTVGGVSQGPTPAGAGAADAMALAPSFAEDSGLVQATENFDCGGSENVNGVDAIVCEADKAVYDEHAAELGGFLGESGIKSVDEFLMKIWLAEDGGYVVRIELDMAGVDMQDAPFTMGMRMNVTDVNNVDEISHD